MASQREREELQTCFLVLSIFCFAAVIPFAAAGLFTHNQHTMATVIAREPSIVNLKLECNMTIIYQVGERFYTGNLLGEQDICESRNPDQLEIRYKIFSPQLYHKLKGDYLYFRTGVVASMLAFAAFYRCVRSTYLLVQLEMERKKIQ